MTLGAAMNAHARLVELLAAASRRIDSFRATRSRVAAIAVVVLLMLPLWGVGIFGRDYWTPDEPREADIAWRMHQSGPQAVPELAGTPFLEKPPLTYWLASAFLDRPDAPAWRARIPNLAYALIVAACVVLLAYEMAAAGGAIMAAVAAGSFLLVYQVSIWLATDAAVMAAAAISLLGLYRGYHATRSREKLNGYLLMHAGLAFGFMSKNAAAWLVPGSTLTVLIVWDRNYRELLRWQLYAGVLLQLACISPWIYAVYHAAGGQARLNEALWANLVGRFIHLRDLNPAMHQYANDHRNWFGKYWLEAPLYLFPWTFLAIAAIRRGWMSLRQPGPPRTEWRFCVAAIFPALTILSLSATGRGIYAAPALIGVGLGLALWIRQLDLGADAFDLQMIAWTARMIALLGVVLVLALPFATLFIRSADLSLVPMICGACIVIASVAALYTWMPETTNAHPRKSLATAYAAYLTIVVGGALVYFPLVDARSDFSHLTAAMHADLQQRPLILVQPDETTRAFVDLGGIDATWLSCTSEDLARAVIELGNAQPHASFLLLRPDRRGPISDWTRSQRRTARMQARDEDLVAMANSAGLRIEREYALPEGRTYVLLSRNLLSAAR